MKHVRITNTDLIREMSSHAVLSTNQSELTRYQRLRQEKLREKQDRASLESRVTSLEARLAALEKK